MGDDTGNPYFAHYESCASIYETINSFKKDIIRQFLGSCPPFTASSVVLDNACGPGIVTGEIQKLVRSSAIPVIHAVDFSPKMIEELNKKAQAEKWQRVESAVVDAEELTFQDDEFTHSITNFGIFLFPDPVQAAKEIYRTLRPGGVAVVTSWYYVGWLTIIQDVLRRLRPKEKVWDGPFPGWMRTSKLEEVMLAGGFQSGKLKITSVTTMLRGRDRDLQLDNMKPAWVKRATVGWSEDDRNEFDAQLTEAFDALKTDDTALEDVTSVATAEK